MRYVDKEFRQKIQVLEKQEKRERLGIKHARYHTGTPRARSRKCCLKFRRATLNKQ